MAREAETVVTTCPLCLGVDDPSAMVVVELELAYPPVPGRAILCRRCCFAVKRALIAADEEETILGVDDGARRSDRGGPVPSGSLGGAETDVVVSGNRPDSEGPGIDRREPAAAAGGGSPSAEEAYDRPEDGVKGA